MRTALLVLALALMARMAAAEERLHGADHDFSARGVRILWAMAKGATEEDTKVVLRIVDPTGAFGQVALDGVDPFAKTRKTLIEPRPIGPRVDLETPRAGFAEWPSREVRLHRGGGLALTVYYLGAPDTTPEFANLAALRAYLDRAETTSPRR